MIPRYLILSLAFLLLFCQRTKPARSGLFETGDSRGKVSLDLEEASGLSASKANPGYLWTLNDSGNSAEIFLIDDRGDIVLTCKLKHGDNRDWEDIAVGPGPEVEGSYVYIGEIGDNDAKYDLKYIYRLPEPQLGKKEKISIDEFDTLIIKLPDGARDMESMTIDQTSGDIYLISKREKNVNVYILAASQQVKHDTLIPTKIATLPYYNVVAADFSLDGSELILKTYDEILYWKKPDSLSIQQVLLTRPILLNYKPEPQGEALAWSLDGSGFYTLSESVDGERAKLYFYKRAK